jgi:hypothetical protein
MGPPIGLGSALRSFLRQQLPAGRQRVEMLVRNGGDGRKELIESNQRILVPFKAEEDLKVFVRQQPDDLSYAMGDPLGAQIGKVPGF